jgi:sec-independent protein translocase protein TatA
MGNVGLPELIFIFALALLVLGPKRLPEVGRSLGKGLAELRRATSGLKESIEREIENAKVEIPASEKTKTSEVGANLDAPKS